MTNPDDAVIAGSEDQALAKGLAARLSEDECAIDLHAALVADADLDRVGRGALRPTRHIGDAHAHVLVAGVRAAPRRGDPDHQTGGGHGASSQPDHLWRSSITKGARESRTSDASPHGRLLGDVARSSMSTHSVSNEGQVAYLSYRA